MGFEYRCISRSSFSLCRTITSKSSFNAASENQCRLTTGAFYSIASLVSYLIVAVLCTSMDAYTSIRTCCYCFIITKDWRRNRGPHDTSDLSPERGESLKNENNDMEVVEETSVSSGDGPNWRALQDEEDDFGESNMAVDSNYSSMKWKISGDSDDLGQNSSTTNPDPAGHPITSASLESSGGQAVGTEDEDDDMALNRIEPATTTNYNSRTFPRQPDLLDMCCAGDPLQVEKHLEYPEVKLRKTKAAAES
jgi:hypothetical protein